MIGHDDEFVKKKLSLIAVMRESLDQKPGDPVAPENGLAISSHGCDKEDAVGVHIEMVAPLDERCL
jgi:hypothetical protein